MTASASVHRLILARCRGSFSPSVFLTVTSKLSSVSHLLRCPLSVLYLLFGFHRLFLMCLSRSASHQRKSSVQWNSGQSHAVSASVSTVAPYEAQKQRSLNKFTVFKVFVVTMLWNFVKSSLRSDFKVMMMLHDNSSVIRDEPRYGAAVTRFSTDYRLNLMLVWHKMCFHLFPLTFYV